MVSPTENQPKINRGSGYLYFKDKGSVMAAVKKLDEEKLKGVLAAPMSSMATPLGLGQPQHLQGLIDGNSMSTARSTRPMLSVRSATPTVSARSTTPKKLASSTPSTTPAGPKTSL